MAESIPESGPKTGMAKMSPSITLGISFASHAAGVAAQTGPIIGPAQLAPGGFVFEIEIGHAREIDAVDGEVGLIMRIAFGQGDIGVAVDVAGEELALDFAELKAIVREEKTPGNAIDRQRLAKKDVIHSGGRIDRQFEVIVRRAEMNDAVHHDVGRLAELVGRDFLEELRLDPEDRFGRVAGCS